MFDKDGKLDERSQRILSEQTIPPLYGRSPATGALKAQDQGADMQITIRNQRLLRALGFEPSTNPSNMVIGLSVRGWVETIWWRLTHQRCGL